MPHLRRTGIRGKMNNNDTNNNVNNNNNALMRSGPTAQVHRNNSNANYTDQSSNSSGPSSSISSGIWYFGYGPIVHPTVRERREVATSQHQAALLPEHRLTFAYGGVANIVPARGFSVQGILMKVDTVHDWEKLKAFDAGQYDPEVLEVYPYDYIDHSSDDPTESFDPEKSIQAYVFVMKEYDECKLSKPIENKPQERYLKLIAQGMMRYGADETYVQDEIMGCPYIPTRQADNWYSFPLKSEKLPTISFEKYQKLCRKSTKDLYFILHDYVLKADDHDPGNPGSMWMRQHAHGKEDLSFLCHKIVVDPDLPYAGTPRGMTPQHYLWAENHCFEFLQQAGFSATKVFRLENGSDTAEANGTDERRSRGRGGWRQSLRESLARSTRRHGRDG